MIACMLFVFSSIATLSWPLIDVISISLDASAASLLSMVLSFAASSFVSAGCAAGAMGAGRGLDAMVAGAGDPTMWTGRLDSSTAALKSSKAATGACEEQADRHRLSTLEVG